MTNLTTALQCRTAAQIAHKALGTNWDNTESAARRVAECAETLLTAALPALAIGLVPVPFVVGNSYQQQDGKWIRFVKVYREGTDYETMEDENGVHRYTSRDFGRVTGTSHDYSEPMNTPPLYTVAASFNFADVRPRGDRISTGDTPADVMSPMMMLADSLG